MTITWPIEVTGMTGANLSTTCPHIVPRQIGPYAISYALSSPMSVDAATSCYGRLATGMESATNARIDCRTGGDTLITVSATGNGTTFSWQYNTDADNGTNIGWTLADGVIRVGEALTKASYHRARFRQQLSSMLSSKHLDLVRENTPEAKARGLLREMVGDKAFLQYVKKGFISVRGKTGLIYRISPHGMTSYARRPDGGYEKFENICIVFKEHGIPPTDAVIMRKLLVEHDEFGMRSKANISRIVSASRFGPDVMTLAS